MYRAAVHTDSVVLDNTQISDDEIADSAVKQVHRPSSYVRPCLDQMGQRLQEGKPG